MCFRCFSNMKRGPKTTGSALPMLFVSIRVLLFFFSYFCSCLLWCFDSSSSVLPLVAPSSLLLFSSYFCFSSFFPSSPFLFFSSTAWNTPPVPFAKTGCAGVETGMFGSVFFFASVSENSFPFLFVSCVFGVPGGVLFDQFIWKKCSCARKGGTLLFVHRYNALPCFSGSSASQRIKNGRNNLQKFVCF